MSQFAQPSFVSLVLRSIVFNLAFYLWTFLMMVLALPQLLFGKPQSIVHRMTEWGAGTNWLLKTLCDIEVEIRGEHHLPRQGCYLVAAKHQSAWDVLAFNRSLGVPAIVMKKEILWLPFAGLYAYRMNMIPVDRKAKNAAAQMVESSRAAVAAGRPILIFPQGTRVAPGSRLPYRGGIAALYEGLRLPVVPAAVNSGLYWPRRKLLRYPGKIILEFLPPIAPGLTRDALMARLESDIEAATRRLEDEGRGSNNPRNNAVAVEST